MGSNKSSSRLFMSCCISSVKVAAKLFKCKERIQRSQLIHNSILSDHRPYSPYSQPWKKSESANSRFQSFALWKKNHIGFLCYSILPNLLYRTLKFCHETTQKALEVDGGTSPSHVYIQVIRICTKWILQLDGNGMQNPEDKNRHKCKNTSGIIEMFTLWMGKWGSEFGRVTPNPYSKQNNIPTGEWYPSASAPYF